MSESRNANRKRAYPPQAEGAQAEGSQAEPWQVNDLQAVRQRVDVWYSGHVQGVGFRQRTRTIAVEFAVDGEVRNLSDGRVELRAEGSPAELTRFLRAVDESLGGFIRGKQVEWSAATGSHPGFCVAPDRFVG